MNLTVSRQRLVEALSIVCKAITKGDMPILKYVRLGLDGDRLSLSTTNLEISIIKVFKLFSGDLSLMGQKGSSLLPGPYVLSLLSKSSEERVSLAWEQKDEAETFTICFGSLKSKIKNIPPAAEFPEIPVVGQEGISVGGLDLERLLGLALPFASNDRYDETVRSILFRMDAVQLAATATDKHRLAVIKMNHGGLVQNEFSCILPKDSVKALLPIVRDDKVVISQSGRLLGFRGFDWQAIVRLVEGEYPNFHGVIPKGYKLKAEIQKDSLVRALKICSQVSDADPGLDLHFGEELYIRNQGQYGDAEQPVEGMVLEGESLAENNLDIIRFSSRYMFDAVRQIQSKHVILETEGYARPIKVYGKTPMSNWEEFYLVLPIRRDVVEAKQQPDPDEQEEPETAGFEESEEHLCGACMFYGTENCPSVNVSPDDFPCSTFHPAQEPVEAAV